MRDNLPLRGTLKDAHRVWSVAFSPDGTLLASGSDDKTVKLWDVKTGKVKATLKGHSGVVWSVVFSPDGALLASGSSDNDCTVKLWDVKTGQVKATLKGHHKPVISVAFSPDGAVLASGSLDATVKLWDVKTGQVKATLKEHTESVDAVAFSPDGALLASGSHDKTIKLRATKVNSKEGPQTWYDAARHIHMHTLLQALDKAVFPAVAGTPPRGSRQTRLEKWRAALTSCNSSNPEALYDALVECDSSLAKGKDAPKVRSAIQSWSQTQFTLVMD